MAFAALLLRGPALLNDPDTLWHIAAGRWIRAHHAVPFTDIFSHTVPGAPWTAHEWLAEAVLAGTYDQFGWTGVVVLAALCGGAAFGLLAYALSRHLSARYVALIVAFSFMIGTAQMSARPHLLAMPLMVVWIAGLMRAREDERAPSMWLVPAMALWANLHGGFIVGLGIAGVLGLEAVMAAPASRRTRTVTRWGSFLAAAAFASLATPHGIEGWLFPFRLMEMGASLAVVNEWHAPDFTKLQPLEIWLAGLAVALIAVRPRIPLLRALIVLGLVYLALTHVRNAELLAFLAPPVLAPSFAGGAGDAAASRRVRDRWLGAGALVLAVTAAAPALPRDYAPANRIMPVAALRAAEAAQVAGPVFNDYRFGGYLIFKGVPVFVDGRIDLYGPAFMADYLAARTNADDALMRLLDRYRVGWTLLGPEAPAAKAMDRLPGWERVYADSIAVVHKRIR